MPIPKPPDPAPGIDSPDPFPFAPFLASLAAGGLRPTLRDYQRISLVLRARGPWTVAGLRGVLAPLLVRDPEQDEVFQRCFDRFFTPQSELRPPSSEIDLERVLNDLAVLAREPLARRPEETPPAGSGGCRAPAEAADERRIMEPGRDPHRLRPGAAAVDVLAPAGARARSRAARSRAARNRAARNRAARNRAARNRAART